MSDDSEETEVDREEQPEIEAEEYADVDPDSLADEIEDKVGASSEDADGGAVGSESDGTDGSDVEPTGAEEGELGLDGETWGDLYVGTLTTFSNALIEEYGQEDAEPVTEDLARQLHLDEYMNDFLAAKGKREDMPPEQALLISTCIFVVVVVGSKTDLPSRALEEASL